MTTRIVVFAGELSHEVARTIVELDRRFGAIEWLVVNDDGPRRDVGSLDAPGAEYRPGRLLARPNVAHADAQGEAADLVAHVRTFAPDLCLSLGAPRLPRGLADGPRLGTIRLHKGKLPDYDGEAPVFWALWRDERELVCTVELVSAAGRGVIAEHAVPRPKYATVAGMELLLGEAGRALVGDAIARILSGTTPAPLHASAAGDRRLPRPTRAQRAALDRRLAAALPRHGPFYRDAAKAGYLLTRLYLGQFTAALSRRPFVTVLTYHRVNDDLRDNVTVGIEQFDRQMAVLAQHCELVSIEAVVAGVLPRRPRRPLACVTFDDGYKDNFTAAFPILLKHQVPAAFFVSTGFIDTTRRFPHDLEKGLTDLPNMSWDDLRTMRRQGYVIGSHTVSHIDCAKTASEELRRELVESRAALAREVGVDNAVFAYPFGRRENMSPAALARVRDAGYSGCLSAYGGVNRGTIEPFDVRRGGVNWRFSALAFLCRAYGVA